MKRKIKAFLVICCLAICLTLCLTACRDNCVHTYDNACDATCNECGETREVSAHDYAAATCTAPKTCKICGATEGEALGHTWTNADCDTPKTCSVCGATDGNALGHTPEADDGDCTTEVKCTVCGDVTTPAKAEHIAHADDNNCLTAVTCTACDTVIVEAKTAHDLSGEWLSDIDGHWHACKNNGCTVIPDKTGHTEGTDGKCTVCEYVITPHTHSYTEIGYDETHHFMKCSCGAKDESTMVGHSAADDGDCTTPDKCTCGYTVRDAADHVAGEDDGDCTTAIKCKNCDQIAKSGNQSHAYGTITYTWANGYSSCTATRSCTVDGCDHTETETKTATQDGTIFTVDFDNEVFATQTIDASMKIDGVTVKPWGESNINGGEAEEDEN